MTADSLLIPPPLIDGFAAPVTPALFLWSMWNRVGANLRRDSSVIQANAGRGGCWLIANTVYQLRKGQRDGERAAAIKVPEIKEQSAGVTSTPPQLGRYGLETAEWLRMNGHYPQEHQEKERAQGTGPRATQTGTLLQLCLLRGRGALPPFSRPDGTFRHRQPSPAR